MGGTQFNGRALVHELVRAGHDVTVCNRGRTPAELPAGVRRLIGDRTDHQSLRDALGGTDWDCVYDFTAYHPPDVEIMLELLEGRTGHYVFASSTVIYAASDVLPVGEEDGDERGPDQNEYGLHKLLCEDLLRAAHAERGFPATTVAFSMVFGPHNTLYDREQRMFARLLSGRPVLVPGDGTTLLQLGHVDDQARALEQMMGKPVTFGRRYNLTGRHAVTRNGYIDLAEQATGHSARRVTIPAERATTWPRCSSTRSSGTSARAAPRPTRPVSTGPSRMPSCKNSANPPRGGVRSSWRGAPAPSRSGSGSGCAACGRRLGPCPG